MVCNPYDQIRGSLAARLIQTYGANLAVRLILAGLMLKTTVQFPQLAARLIFNRIWKFTELG